MTFFDEVNKQLDRVEGLPYEFKQGIKSWAVSKIKKLQDNIMKINMYASQNIVFREVSEQQFVIIDFLMREFEVEESEL